MRFLGCALTVLAVNTLFAALVKAKNPPQEGGRAGAKIAGDYKKNAGGWILVQNTDK